MICGTTICVEGYFSLMLIHGVYDTQVESKRNVQGKLGVKEASASGNSCEEGCGFGQSVMC